MDPKLRKIIELINSKKKSSFPWTRQEAYNQPYYTFSPEKESWIELQPSRSSIPLTTTFSVLSWNIDFMLPFASERMSAAIAHLHTLVSSPSSSTTTTTTTPPPPPPPPPAVIFLQEMLESDLTLLQSQPWVRESYHLTDISSAYWESGHYGTCTLISKQLPIASVFRVHYEATKMERDALFVDVFLAGTKRLRLCNTHLESLIADPPLRPPQLATAAHWMHSDDVVASVLAGDLNAIQPFDRTLHSDNGLADAYLALGGREDSDEGYTWGQMAPTRQRDMFGCSRMDKVFFCGGVEVLAFQRFGMGVEVESEEGRRSLIKEEGMECGWVTDHLGVKADFRVVGGGEAGEESRSSSKI